MKLFEEFINDAFEMQNILDKIKKRITYWFQNGEFSLRANQVDMQPSESPNSSKKSIIINFGDSDFYYQIIVRMNIEDLENCDVIIKKYDPTQIEMNGGGEPIDTLELTNDQKVAIDDIQEDFIIRKLGELEDRDKNPDKNKINSPKEKKESEPQSPTPAQAQAPAPPPAQAPAPPPAQAPTPPPAQATAPIL